MTASIPIYEKEPFMNDFAEVADTWRQLITSFEREEIPFKAYEPIPGTTGSAEISTTVLINMLKESEDFS